MQDRVRFFVGGVGVDAVDLAESVATIARWIAIGRREYVALLGAHGIVEMQQDRDLRCAYEGAGLVVPDGMPLVWIARASGYRQTGKVTGAPLMHAVVRHGLPLGYRHFFYGGAPGVAERVARRLEQRHPGVRIAGVHAPGFGELDEARMAEDARAVRAARCDIVWVGLGCPKQERWMARLRPRLDAPVLVGVGAAFDFVAGTKPLSPRWVQRSGFEWLFRLASEPRRLWPRYRRVLPRFVGIVARDALHTRLRHG